MNSTGKIYESIKTTKLEKVVSDGFTLFIVIIYNDWKIYNHSLAKEIDKKCLTIWYKDLIVI